MRRFIRWLLNLCIWKFRLTLTGMPEEKDWEYTYEEYIEETPWQK